MTRATALLSQLVIGSPDGAAVEYLRDLNEADLAALATPARKETAALPLRQMRRAHHMLAKLIADGVKHVEAASITGYSPSRISVLVRDPAFSELVSYYSSQAEVAYLDVHNRLATLGMSTVEELQERLEASPEEFSNKELRELAEFALDRSVTPQARQGGSGQAPGTSVAIEVKFVQPAARPIDIIDIQAEELPSE